MKNKQRETLLKIPLRKRRDTVVMTARAADAVMILWMADQHLLRMVERGLEEKKFNNSTKKHYQTLGRNIRRMMEKEVMYDCLSLLGDWTAQRLKMNRRRKKKI